MKYVIYRDAQDQFRWRLYAASGVPLAAGVDGYATKALCMDVIRQVRQSAAAEVEDQAASTV